MEFFHSPNINWLGKKWYFIASSFVLSGAGLVSLLVHGGPRYGIDFRGGTQVHVKFREAPQLDRVRQALRSQGLGNSTLQRYGPESAHEILIGLDLESTTEQDLDAGKQTIVNSLQKEFGGGGKTNWNEASPQVMTGQLLESEALQAKGLAAEQLLPVAQRMAEFRDSRGGFIAGFDELRPVEGVTPEILQGLQERFSLPGFAVRNVEIVGPKVGAALRRQAMNATLLGLGAMLIYIAFRFEWIYGVAATLATAHDVIITVGLLSITGQEITLTVIAALLTLVGYSVNDTIVVFDRIRENVKLLRRERLSDIVNRSINQTLSRTVLTSGLTFLTVLSLFVFGGEVLRGFAFALVVGIVVGTYSSIAIASPMVVSWNEYTRQDRRGGTVVPIEREQGKSKRANLAKA
jgi:preprotein translocase subunit SecF